MYNLNNNDLFAIKTDKSSSNTTQTNEAYAEKIINLAHCFFSYLKRGKKIDAKFARTSITNIFGGTDADGVWNWKDIYEAQEVACILTIRHYTASLMRKSFEDRLESLNALQAYCLTHTKRSENSVKFNQFSTPLPYALFAVECANLTSNDVVLEPSAGTGIIASLAQMHGAEVIVNEYEPKRFAITKELFKNAYNLDGRYIRDTLDINIKPTAIIMNPPFNIDDPATARSHLKDAFDCLENGGRLVAITSKEKDISKTVLKASVSGQAFYKHGTSVDTFIHVRDKGTQTADHTRNIETRFEFKDAIALLPNRLEIVATKRTKSLNKLIAKEQAKFLEPTPVQKLVINDEIDWKLSEELEYEAENWVASDLEDIGIYQNYVPQSVSITGAKDHPADLVQSIAMNSTCPPTPVYKPVIPQAIVTQGILSEAQLETVIYAGQAHSTFLEGKYSLKEKQSDLYSDDENGSEYRRGYFLGDGTGCGKGRQVAGVILDNWLQGRTKALWLSINDKLLEDAQRDWGALGGKSEQIVQLNKFKYGTKISMDKGIMFVTYGTLSVGARENKTSRLDQLVEWLGEDFDGVIAFDEAHAMANAIESKAERGIKKASARGIQGLRLQYLLPKARILYVSATGASTVSNLAYADRLGLWRGGDTAFLSKTAFISKMNSGGIGAMEVISRDMKSLGLYTARSLSYNGTEVNILEHNLTDDQINIYDVYAKSYQIIHENLCLSLAQTGAQYNSETNKNALGKFESSKQRFFNHLLCGMKCITVIKDIEHQLEQGNSCVIQIVSTAESLLEKRLQNIPISEYKDVRVDITPREYILEYLMNSFPIYTYETYVDGTTTKSQLLYDDDGNPVINQMALKMKEDLLNKIMLLPAIPSALDQIIHYFGDDKVAEVTGRSKRLIYKEGKMLVSKRNAKSNTVETNAFMDDKKQILIFSKSGGTGRSYHADLSRKNQRRRIHYLLEAGWKADDAIQGLGRSHRTNQASAPMFRPVATNVKGEKRFLATIAKRLDSMGAITKGERKSGSQGMFREEDNLDTEYARKALNTFFDEVFYGNKESVITLDELERKTGLRFTNKDGTKKDNLPPITQFLNRMLALEINVQNMLFARFDEIHQAIIRDAKASGVFEVGVEDFKADNIKLKETHHIYTHERTHTDTNLKIFTTYHKIIIRNAQEMLDKLIDNEEVEFTRNKISQRVAIAYNGGQSIDMKTGRPYKQKHIVRPNNSSINIKPEEFYDKYEPLTDTQGIEMWNTEIKDLSTVQEKQVNLITGALLPIWSNLPTGNNKVYRLTDDDGNSHLGVVVGNEHIENFINRLQNRDNTDLSSEELANKIINNNVVEFMNNWQVKQSLVMSMARIEIVIPANKMIEEFELDKLKSEFLAFTEIINYQLRIFIPTTYLIDILEYLTKVYHIKA